MYGRSGARLLCTHARLRDRASGKMGRGRGVVGSGPCVSLLSSRECGSLKAE